MKKLLFKKTLLPEWTLNPHCMYAVLAIARGGHLRRNTLVNQESSFTRLMTVENSDKIAVFQTKPIVLRDLFCFFFTGFPVELAYQEWALRIDSAFEENFWIPEEPKQNNEEEKLVHRRCIYKDTLGASHRFADYQLRPNICVAMTVVSVSSSVTIKDKIAFGQDLHTIGMMSHFRIPWEFHKSLTWKPTFFPAN